MLTNALATIQALRGVVGSIRLSSSSHVDGANPMLKTSMGKTLWLVQQPDHARVSGYLAAHWGGVNGFVRPGYFAPSAQPERLRQAVIQAIAEHDNGWWEWEASPPLDPNDQLPLGLGQVVRQQSPQQSLQRWRLGVPRFADQHPYVALLISLHGSLLYTFLYDEPQDRITGLPHPLFGNAAPEARPANAVEEYRRFLAEQRAIQVNLCARLRQDPVWAQAVEPAHREPHTRLLQLMDALSLLLGFGGEQEKTLAEIPRRHWDDRVTLTWRPGRDRRIICEPYPFDADPLPVFLPVRILPGGVAAAAEAHASLPLTRIHAAPLQTIRFELVSQDS